METNSILKADILDIIFENKNKEYGAYELRKTYNKRIKIAMGSMIGICLLASVATVMANNNDGKKPELLSVTDVTLENVKPVEPPVVPPPPPPPPPAEPQRVQVEKFTTVVVAHDDQVVDPPPANDDLDDVAIGPMKQDGIKDPNFVAPPPEVGVGKVEAPKVIDDVDKEFKTVQIQAKFPGGGEAWVKYLTRNLKSETPSDNGAPTGNYTVVVSFLVDKEGDISEVKSENDPGYGTAAEAVRVIQRGPKWIPAVQNGRNVIFRQKQQITFQVQEQQ